MRIAAAMAMIGSLVVAGADGGKAGVWLEGNCRAERMDALVRYCAATRRAVAEGRDGLLDGSGFLAAETWPDLRGAEGLDAKEVRRNLDEYNAPIYFTTDLMAVRMLAEFARDAEMKRRGSRNTTATCSGATRGATRGFWRPPSRSLEYAGETLIYDFDTWRRREPGRAAGRRPDAAAATRQARSTSQVR